MSAIESSTADRPAGPRPRSSTLPCTVGSCPNRPAVGCRSSATDVMRPGASRGPVAVVRRRGRRWSSRSSRGSTGSARSIRCSRIRRSPRSWSTAGPGVDRAARPARAHRRASSPPTAIEHLIERIVGPLGLRVDRSSPMVDARLPDGSRVNAVVPPLAVDGPCLTISRFGARPIELDDMAEPPVAELLRWAVRSRANIVVSGGAGAGKTTLLNALAASIPAHERIITVEDAAELRLPGEHVVRLEARPASAEGAGAVTIRAAGAQRLAHAARPAAGRRGTRRRGVRPACRP